MRAFPVVLPSGARYWTVVDEEVRPVPIADQWLRYLRFSKDRAESTTKSYAGGAALYLFWCELTGRDWRVAARDLGLFILWLKWTPSTPARSHTNVVYGPGSEIVRRERRSNTVLTAVRGLLSHAVSLGEAPNWVLGQLYELADSSSLPP